MYRFMVKKQGLSSSCKDSPFFSSFHFFSVFHRRHCVRRYCCYGLHRCCGCFHCYGFHRCNCFRWSRFWMRSCCGCSWSCFLRKSCCGCSWSWMSCGLMMSCCGCSLRCSTSYGSGCSADVHIRSWSVTDGCQKARCRACGPRWCCLKDGWRSKDGW